MRLSNNNPDNNLRHINAYDVYVLNIHEIFVNYAFEANRHNIVLAFVDNLLNFIESSGKHIVILDLPMPYVPINMKTRKNSNKNPNNVFYAADAHANQKLFSPNLGPPEIFLMKMRTIIDSHPKLRVNFIRYGMLIPSLGLDDKQLSEQIEVRTSAFIGLAAIYLTGNGPKNLFQVNANLIITPLNILIDSIEILLELNAVKPLSTILKASLDSTNQVLITLTQICDYLNYISNRIPYSKSAFKADKSRFTVTPDDLSQLETAKKNAVIFSASLKAVRSYLFNKDRTHYRELEKQIKCFHYTSFAYEQEGIKKPPAGLIRPLQFDLTLSACLIKRDVLGEYIQDIKAHSQYFEMNSKKVHRDRYFDDLRFAYDYSESSVKDFDSRELLDYRESDLINSKIKETVKDILSATSNPSPHLEAEILTAIDKDLKKITEVMLGFITKSYISPFFYFAMKILKHAFNQILVDKELEITIKTHKSRNKGPIIFTPSHKSYLDFILVSFLTHFLKEKLPYICSDETLSRIFIVSLTD